MMDGITVLNVVEKPIFGAAWSIPAAFMFILAVFGLIVILLGLVVRDREIIGLGLLIALVFGIIGSAVYSTGRVVGYYNEYSVTINESVLFSEFSEYYEILEQEGLIYKIRERKQEQ